MFGPAPTPLSLPLRFLRKEFFGSDRKSVALFYPHLKNYKIRLLDCLWSILIIGSKVNASPNIAPINLI